MHAAIFCSVQRTISRAIGWLDGKGRISSSSSPSERGFTDWSSYKKEQESAAARGKRDREQRRMKIKRLSESGKREDTEERWRLRIEQRERREISGLTSEPIERDDGYEGKDWNLEARKGNAAREDWEERVFKIRLRKKALDRRRSSCRSSKNR